MKIVQGDQIEVQQRKNQHRAGTFLFRTLMEGTPGTPDNFFFTIADTTDDFFSPRHKHNFDQYRFQLTGDFDFDRNGRMVPGILGYFPEGTHYGPQSSSSVCSTLVLQFGGASGQGYLAREQVETGAGELKKLGEFKDGVFRRPDGTDGKRNVDGYQAVWEHVNGRPMVYPKPRYHDPIMVDPANFAWMPAGVPGVSEKLLGVFNERRTGARFLKLAPGATYTLTDSCLAFVTSGTGTLANQDYRPQTTLWLLAGESAAWTAATETEFLVLDLPRFDSAPALAAAAE